MKLRWYRKALSPRRKVMRDVVARTTDGKLFHVRRILLILTKISKYNVMGRVYLHFSVDSFR